MSFLFGRHISRAGLPDAKSNKWQLQYLTWQATTFDWNTRKQWHGLRIFNWSNFIGWMIVACWWKTCNLIKNWLKILQNMLISKSNIRVRLPICEPTNEIYIKFEIYFQSRLIELFNSIFIMRLSSNSKFAQLIWFRALQYRQQRKPKEADDSIRCETETPNRN